MKLLSLILLFGFSQTLWAFPQAPYDALERPDGQHQLWKDHLVTPYDFNGIVKLSNCSGAVVRFSGQPDTAKALVLTNGHCLGWPFIEPGKSVHNKYSSIRMRVSDANLNFIPVRAERLLYATMTRTDSALYRLRQTYEDLQKKGIDAFEIRSDAAIVGTPIQVISGYWERGFECSLKYYVHELIESRWSFLNSLRYSDKGCEVYGGTSGSPVVETGTRIVVGVNNTGNESGERCTMNNPCEVDDKGNVLVEQGASYGQQVHLFYNCLTIDFEIDTSLPGCLLP